MRGYRTVCFWYLICNKRLAHAIDGWLNKQPDSFHTFSSVDRSILTAASTVISHWSFGGTDERVENSFGIATSQPALTPDSAQGGVHGSHVIYSRVGSNSYLSLGSAYAVVVHELTHELVLQDLPSFSTVLHFKPHRQPIHDVKCAYAVNQRLVGCSSEDTLQLFRDNLYD